CTPPSCAGLYCGDVSSCGLTQHCGDCQSGQECFDGTCCTPRTCASLPATACGGPDGCGGNLDCPCPGATTCNPSTWTCGACVPTNPCAAGACGTQDDGCGNTIDCGACKACVPVNPCSDACGL